MEKVTRFGVSIDSNVLKKFDSFIDKKGYSNRSKAIEDILRNCLLESSWENEKETAVGIVTLVYSHHTREISDRLTELQHKYHTTIISTLHIHLDKHNCLEILVVKDTSEKLKKLNDEIITTRGVKHSKLLLTASEKYL